MCWLGLRTQQFDEMVKFFRDVMDMKPIRDEPGIMGFQMIDGTNLELINSMKGLTRVSPRVPLSPFA